MTIGDRIRRIRKKRRLTQAELAMMSGLSLSAIQGYEQGRYEPKRKSLESIAEVFKIPVDELYDMPVEHGTNLASLGTDCISRQAAIETRRYTFGNDEFSLEAAYHDCKLVFDGITDDDSFQEADTGLILYYANEIIYALQKALEGKDTNVTGSCSEIPNNSTLQQTCNQLATDCISRQEAIDALHMHLMYRMGTDSNKKRLDEWINNLPSAQPEQHTCVNCGRTVNNGGWYADGRTRCPIEEHYALPKDGYCHLWEKRNVTDDDYPERRTDERFNQQTGGD